MAELPVFVKIPNVGFDTLNTGSNVYTITDAILGCKKEIPTLYGNVILTIPSGTQNEDRHRIKGKGIENIQTKRNGDMFVIIKVITPTKLDRKQKELIKELSDTDLENEKFNRYNSYTKRNK